MKNLLSRKLRGLAVVAAVATCAALAMPNAQAAPAASTATTAANADRPAPAPVDHPVGVEQGQFTAAGWTRATAYNAVVYNKFYNTGKIPASGCKRPNVALNTEYRVRYFENELVRCMYAAWKGNLWRAGARWDVRPTVIVHGYNTVKSKCGSVTGWISFYCAAGGGTIYIPWRQIVTYYSQNPTYAVAYATNTIAHEYGHHIQNMTGILTASHWRQYYMTTNDTKLAESRRRELQASCLGSAYIGANRIAYPMSGGLYTEWRYLISHSGDMPGYPRDHGSWTNHDWWSMAGFKGNGTYQHPGSCRTWSAPGTRIS